MPEHPETDLGDAQVYQPDDVRTRFMKLSRGMGGEDRPVWVKVWRRTGLRNRFKRLERPFRYDRHGDPVPAMITSLDSMGLLDEENKQEEVTIIHAKYADGQRITIDTRGMVWKFVTKPVRNEYVEHDS